MTERSEVGARPPGVDFYRSATAMTALPQHHALADLPDDLDAVRGALVTVDADQSPEAVAADIDAALAERCR